MRLCRIEVGLLLVVVSLSLLPKLSTLSSPSSLLAIDGEVSSIVDVVPSVPLLLLSM